MRGVGHDVPEILERVAASRRRAVEHDRASRARRANDQVTLCDCGSNRDVLNEGTALRLFLQSFLQKRENNRDKDLPDHLARNQCGDGGIGLRHSENPCAACAKLRHDDEPFSARRAALAAKAERWLLAQVRIDQNYIATSRIFRRARFAECSTQQSAHATVLLEKLERLCLTV